MIQKRNSSAKDFDEDVPSYKLGKLRWKKKESLEMRFPYFFLISIILSHVRSVSR